MLRVTSNDEDDRPLRGLSEIGRLLRVTSNDEDERPLRGLSEIRRLLHSTRNDEDASPCVDYPRSGDCFVPLRSTRNDDEDDRPCPGTD